MTGSTGGATTPSRCILGGEAEDAPERSQHAARAAARAPTPWRRGPALEPEREVAATRSDMNRSARGRTGSPRSPTRCRTARPTRTEEGEAPDLARRSSKTPRPSQVLGRVDRSGLMVKDGDGLARDGEDEGGRRMSRRRRERHRGEEQGRDPRPCRFREAFDRSPSCPACHGGNYRPPGDRDHDSAALVTHRVDGSTRCAYCLTWGVTQLIISISLSIDSTPSPTKEGRSMASEVSRRNFSDSARYDGRAPPPSDLRACEEPPLALISSAPDVAL